MSPKHARARVAHDGLDLVAPVPLVAMYGAPGARGFGGAELAAVESSHRIIQQFLALWTECGGGRGGRMVRPAIAGHHRSHGLGLAGQTSCSPAGETLGSRKGKMASISVVFGRCVDHQ